MQLINLSINNLGVQVQLLLRATKTWLLWLRALNRFTGWLLDGSVSVTERGLWVVHDIEGGVGDVLVHIYGLEIVCWWLNNCLCSSLKSTSAVTLSLNSVDVLVQLSELHAVSFVLNACQTVFFKRLKYFRLGA